MKTIKNLRQHISKRLIMYVGGGYFDLKKFDFRLYYPFDEDYGQVSYLKLVGNKVCIHNSSCYARSIDDLSIEDLVRLFRLVVRNFSSVS